MDEINIFITGDFCPVHESEKILIGDFDTKDIFGRFSKIIKKSDISITNLECPLTLVDNPIDKIGPNLKADPKIANTIKKVGFDLITLANNHIYDQGQKGLLDTIQSLENKEINFVGSGESLEEAQKPYYKTLKGMKLAFLNFAEVEFSCANENHGGANPMDIIDNFHQIKSAKKEADKVIVIIHGGQEHHYYPSPKTKKRYRFFAESGADAIIAHHPHCIKGYEIYEGVPIFYSLGNFLFPSFKKHKKTWFEGYAVDLKIGEDDIDFDILPYEQCKNDEISIDFKSAKSDLYKKIEKISNELDNDKLIKSKLKQYIKGEKEEVFLGRMAGNRRSTIYAFRMLGLFRLLKFFIRKKDIMFIKQMITCQAHREKAIEILKNYLKY